MTARRTSTRHTNEWPLFPTLKRAKPGADFMAGITLAAVAIPEQLATGGLAGLTPAAGLVAFAAGSLAFAALGRSRTLSVGADSTIAPVIAGAIAGAAASHTGVETSAAVLAAMVGIILIGMRILRLSWLADLLSAPIGAGLMAGIAVHIAVGRLPSLLNLEIPALPIGQTIIDVAKQIGAADPFALMLGFGVALGCALGHRFAPRWPVALAAIAVSSIAAATIDPDGTRMPRVGTLSGGLPWFGGGLPGPETIVSLLPAALTIAFLCITQTLAIEQEADHGATGSLGMLRDRLTEDGGAIGAANVLAAIAGTFPVNSSPPRSAIAAAAGARSQLTSLIAGSLALAGLFGFNGLIRAIPVAALSGVLLFVAMRILPVRRLVNIFRRSPDELILAAAAALLVIVLPVQTGTAMALMLGVLHAAGVSLRPQAGELLRVPGTTVWWRARTGERGERLSNVLVLGIGAPLNFITTPRVIDALDEALDARPMMPKLVVLEAAGVLAIDITGAELLIRRIAKMQQEGIWIAIARLEAGRAAREAEVTGLIAAIAPENVFLTVDEAVRRLHPT